MKLLLARPAEGVAWVRRAFQVFFRQPLGFTALFAACALVLFVLIRVPLIGRPILLLIAPLGSLLFMIASRLSVAGERPVPGAFLALAAADRPRIVRMLKLGLAYLVAAFVAIGLIAVVEGDALVSLLDTAANPQATPEAIEAQLGDSRLQAGFLLRVALGALLSIPFWHAPGLVWWGEQGWAKALFFSSVAIWRNKGAFAVYGLAWMALWLLLLAIVSLGVGLFGAQRFTLVATPLTLVFSTIFYASLWFTFADCFAPAGADAAPRDDPDPDPFTKGSP